MLSRWPVVALCFVFTVIAITAQAADDGDIAEDCAWAIIKISYDPETGRAEGGSAGTVFFLNDRTFLTTNHGMEEGTDLLLPNEGFPNVRVLLANDRGDTIDDFWIVEWMPELDLAVGHIRSPHNAVRSCAWATELNVGDEVFNIGFPSDRKLEDLRLAIRGDKLIIKRIRPSPEVQRGEVIALGRATVVTADVNIHGQPIILLSYSSRTGFSGGPLISVSTSKVVGFMSFVLPEESDAQRRAVAIPMIAISEQIEKLTNGTSPRESD